jgi:hypothetical protein
VPVVYLTSWIGYEARATASGLVTFDAASGNVQTRCAVCCTDTIAKALVNVFEDSGKCGSSRNRSGVRLHSV